MQWLTACVACLLVVCLRQNVHLSDGSVQSFGTGDGSTAWLASSDGPIVSSSVYGGQTTDLTRSPSAAAGGSSLIGYDSSWRWSPAVWSPAFGGNGNPCTTAGCTSLTAQMNGSVLVRLAGTGRGGAAAAFPPP